MTDPAALHSAFAHTMAGVRRVLERVPADRLDFRPHPRSWSAGELATHLARLPSWTHGVLAQDFYDLLPNEAPGAVAPLPAALAEILALFEKNIAAAGAAIAAADTARLSEPWELRRGPTTLSTMKRGEALREYVIDHSIHHRAQLTVWLRLMDVPVPALYGPTADERG